MADQQKSSGYKGNINWQDLDTQLKKLLHDRNLMCNEEQFFKKASIAETDQTNMSWEEKIYQIGSNTNLLIQSYEGMTKWANFNQQWLNKEIQ